MAEKSLNEIGRDVRLLYQKAHDALLRENYDYAVDLFTQVLDKEPGLLDARKGLRTAQNKKSGDSGGFFKKAWSSASSSPMVAKGQLALRKDPTEALQIAEQVLNSDPGNSSAHRIVVEAANTLGMPRTAVMSLEVLSKNSPKDKAVLIQFARALAEVGEGRRAEKILTDFARLFPLDNEISQTLKNLSATKTLSEGGYDTIAGGQGSYRDILRNEGESIALEQANRVQKGEDVAERLIAEYEERLPAEAGNVKLLKSLAELYTQKKQFEKALHCYDQIRATEAGANHPGLDSAVAQTKVKRYDYEIGQLDPAAPEHAETLARLSAEKLAFQVADCQKQVERFPTDLARRYEMGALYFQAGKIGEAIQELQKSQSNPHKRIASMNLLAQCFGKRKMFDLAARTLQNAIKEKVVFDDEKKDLIYNLGCMFEGMGKKEDALEQFKQIYEIDIGYRDVAAKVDSYYSQQ